MLLTILAFIFVFGLVVFAHETGHLIWAKRAGIRVYEYGLGMGPCIWAKKIKETTYSLNLIPIGGFVRIAGLEDEEGDLPCPEKEKYYNKTTGQKAKSIVAGPLANIVLALVIFFFVFTLLGVPTGISNEVMTVVPGSPGEKIGLQSGDKILALNGQKITDMTKTIEVIHQSRGKTLVLNINRQGKIFSLKVRPRYDEKRKIALIGFSPKPIYQRVGPIQGLVRSIEHVVGITLLMLGFLGQLIIGSASWRNIAGPVGIIQFSGQVAQLGFLPLLQFTAFLSINLAILNLLPLPALDGGRLFFLLIEAIRKKPLNIKRENQIHQIGLYVLLALMAIVTVNDLRRFWFK